MLHSSQRHRILLAVTQANWGGAQKYVYDLATRMAAEYEVSVAAGTESRELRDKLANHGIDFHPLPHLVRAVSPFNDLLAIFEFRALVRRLQPDIVHLNSSKAGVVGSIAARLAGRSKIVFTLHGEVLLEPLNPFKWLVYWLAEKVTSPCKDLTIAVSEADKQTTTRYGVVSGKKIVVIPVGLDFSTLLLLPKTDARRKLSEFAGTSLVEKKIIGTIADFYPTKGLSYLIAAIPAVLAKFTHAHFVIVGRGNAAPLRKLAESTGNAQRIHIIDSLTQGAAALLPAFDLFVLPSVKEGLPYTILEAAAAGLPIVATRVGGIPDVITDRKSGLLVPPANPEALAKAMIEVLSNPTTAARLAEAAARAVGEFSLGNMIEKTKAVYRSLLQ